MNELVSINITCYNREELLKECLEGFIKQSYKNLEIIVVDDGSVVPLEWVTSIDGRIKYFRQEHAGRAAEGLELARKKSLGKWIVPFGSDDKPLEEMVETMIKYIEEFPDYDVYYSNGWTLKNGGLKRRKYANYPDEKIAYEEMLKAQWLNHGGTFIRSVVHPPYDMTVHFAEDYELFLTCLEKGLKFKHVKEKLWIYRIHDSQASGSESQNMGCEEVLKRRGYLFNKKTRLGEKKI